MPTLQKLLMKFQAMPQVVFIVLILYQVSPNLEVYHQVVLEEPQTSATTRILEIPMELQELEPSKVLADSAILDSKLQMQVNQATPLLMVPKQH
jgi:hypothetical protein